MAGCGSRVDFAKAEGISLLPRGGGTSQSGQTVNDALVIDFTKHLNTFWTMTRMRNGHGAAWVGFGQSKSPVEIRWMVVSVDVSTASRATLGGMAANNSCGSRSIRYGKMQDNVRALTAMTVDGTTRRFEYADTTQALDADMRALALQEQDEITTRFPKVQRRVGGYNIDASWAMRPTLATCWSGPKGRWPFKSIDLKLSPVLGTKTLGVCHFPTFYAAMDAAQHIVKLGLLPLNWSITT